MQVWSALLTDFLCHYSVRTVWVAVVFLVFLTIVLSSKTIVTSSDNLSYSLLPICPTVSEVTQSVSFKKGDK